MPRAAEILATISHERSPLRPRAAGSRTPGPHRHALTAHRWRTRGGVRLRDGVAVRRGTRRRVPSTECLVAGAVPEQPRAPVCAARARDAAGDGPVGTDTHRTRRPGPDEPRNPVARLPWSRAAEESSRFRARVGPDDPSSAGPVRRRRQPAPWVTAAGSSWTSRASRTLGSDEHRPTGPTRGAGRRLPSRGGGTGTLQTAAPRPGDERRELRTRVSAPTAGALPATPA